MIRADGIRALTFDVVGTLIDFETGILDGVRSVAGGQGPDDEAVLAAFGAAEGVQQELTPEMPFTAMLDPISVRLAADISLPGLTGSPSPLRRSIGSWPAFPDSVEALKVLGERYLLVAVTNADRPALDAMAATLGEPFADGVTVDQVGVNKPDRRMFETALERLAAAGVARDEVLHVAQSQYHDIGAAHRLGLATCWVQRRRGREGYGATPAPTDVTTPDLHVGSMAELIGALRAREHKVSL
ncbi:HAD-IA family hydrolase [Actinomycetospora endophytica]|uniref:HAD-IA family hydrolase n=1 Tax=Actinomycetospora endophytica TaxID=2291215 RepID=A0ABS8PIQ5_9PSEU|nr:HAD-IA family hydrolase [Actinomycetospora endophytica]MCD2197923.1 HAD-IA family hydrolase [Actinomycetospora endophytica]